jgi:DNA-binding MarR family transcriptional regulator
MFINPSTITGVIDRLEKKRFVLRIRSEKDRRIVKVQLTPKGNRLARRAPNPIQGKMIYGLKKLKKDELFPIHHSIEKLVEIMEAHDVEVTFLFDQEK